jgi:hypothetical protein
MSKRYSINYSAAENATIEAAAKAEGDKYVGRWIGYAALEFAKTILSGEKTGGK